MDMSHVQHAIMYVLYVGLYVQHTIMYVLCRLICTAYYYVCVM